MKVTRRSFLAALACLPFLGRKPTPRVIHVKTFVQTPLGEWEVFECVPWGSHEANRIISLREGS